MSGPETYRGILCALLGFRMMIGWRFVLHTTVRPIPQDYSLFGTEYPMELILSINSDCGKLFTGFQTEVQALIRYHNYMRSPPERA